VLKNSGVEELLMNSFSKLSSQQFALIARECINLKRLDVSSTKITHEELRQIVTNCSKLESIVTGECSFTIDEQIIENCGNIQKLIIGNNSINSGVPRCLATHCPHLSILDVAFTEITNEGIITIVNSCKSLISLDVSYCSNITDVVLEEITSNLPNLKSLNISWNPIGCIKPICKLKELEVLGLTGLSEKVNPIDFGIIIQQNPKLIHLFLAEAYFIDDSNLALIGTLKKLQKLVLGSIHFSGSYSSFLHIANCKSLEHLDIGALVPVLDCSSLIVKIVKELPLLKHLDISDIKITEQVLLDLVEVLPNGILSLSCDSDLISKTVLKNYKRKYPNCEKNDPEQMGLIYK